MGLRGQRLEGLSLTCGRRRYLQSIRYFFLRRARIRSATIAAARIPITQRSAFGAPTVTKRSMYRAANASSTTASTLLTTLTAERRGRGAGALNFASVVAVPQ